MSACIALRDDYDSLALRDLARRSRDPRQVRRLLALAATYDGMSRTEAAKVGGMDGIVLRSPKRWKALDPKTSLRASLSVSATSAA